MRRRLGQACRLGRFPLALPYKQLTQGGKNLVLCGNLCRQGIIEILGNHGGQRGKLGMLQHPANDLTVDLPSVEVTRR